jgi:hypothetical protein
LQESGQDFVNPLLRIKRSVSQKGKPKTKGDADSDGDGEAEEEEVLKEAYKLKKPLEVVALIIVGMSGIDGEISPDLQREIELIFEADFGFTRLEAKSLYETCCRKLDDVDNLIREAPKILEPSLLFFRANQVQGLPSMLRTIASLQGPPTPRQLAVIAAVRHTFSQVR